jgi:hypothetical protein
MDGAVSDVLIRVWRWLVLGAGSWERNGYERLLFFKCAGSVYREMGIHRCLERFLLGHGCWHDISSPFDATTWRQHHA